MRRSGIFVLIIAALAASACATQPVVKPHVFMPATEYQGHVRTASATVAAVAVPVEDLALDYRKAGLQVVNLVITNQGSGPIPLSQSAVIGKAGDIFYQPYTLAEATQLITDSGMFQEAVKGFAAGALGGAAAGAALGAIFGAFTGSPGYGAGLGAAAGAATGGVVGAVDYSSRLKGTVHDDLSGKMWGDRTVPGGGTMAGFLYFPAGVNQVVLPLPDQTVGIPVTEPVKQ